MKKILLTLIGLCVTILAGAQTLTIESFKAVDGDISARMNRRDDLNGKPCALLKIWAMDNLVEIQGNNIGDISQKAGGEKWVYLTEGSREVKLFFDRHLPVELKFDDYGTKALESGNTYLLVLTENSGNSIIPSTPDELLKIQEYQDKDEVDIFDNSYMKAANKTLTKTKKETLKKQAKEIAKERTKQGFEIMGNFSMEEEIYRHYIKLETGVTEVVGFGEAGSQNEGCQMCLTEGISEYAAKAVSFLKGLSLAYDNEEGTDNDQLFDRIFTAYELNLQKEIKGELEVSFCLMKKIAEDNYEFHMYFVIDEDKAKKCRQKALEVAVAETGLPQDYAKQMSEFVNESIWM